MDVFDDHPVVRFLAGGLFLAVALFLAGLLAWQLAQDLALWVFGREVKADVIERSVVQLGDQDEGELQFHYYLQYRFDASNGQTVTSTTTVSMNEWASDDEGQVDVIYFALYPAHNRLDDSRYVPLLACLYVPVILIALAMLAAGWQLFRPVLARSGAGEGDARTRRVKRG